MEDLAENIHYSDKIKALFEADQADRVNYAKNPPKGLEIRKRDEEPLQKAREILEKEQIFDPHALNMLAFIFHHGDSIEDSQKALELATKAVDLGLPPENSLIPQATDRLMVREQLAAGTPWNKLTQKYGTETLFDERRHPFKPKLDQTAE